MNILQAIDDDNLLKPFLTNGTGRMLSWRSWRTALSVAYGIKPADKRLVKECTGRSPKLLPENGFDEVLYLTGRRSGKSRIAATVAAFEAAIGGRHKRLHAGEQGMVPIISPTLSQSRIVHGYVREAFERSPLLAAQVVAEQKSGFTLSNGVRIETIAGDWRSVRGYTLLCVVLDECAFLGQDDLGRVRSDTELVRALLPGLATTGGKLVAISSPYARHGWCFQSYEQNFGNNDGDVLVWNAPSRVMNPKLPQSVVDKALKADLASAKAEYLGEFRDDVGAFVSREIVMACVAPGRTAIPPRPGNHYSAFVDLSGGRGDDATLAIAHRSDGIVVVDTVLPWRAPFDPNHVIGQMVEHLRKYGIRKATGDAYAGEFVSRGFERHGVRYLKAPKPKNELYAELLPTLTSCEVELPDYAPLIDQLTRLERRTRSGGRDIIDHPRGGKDDIANAVAGVVFACIGAKKTAIGAF